jgi:primosomal protein N'
MRAETFYRYQLMLRTPHMTKLSRQLAELVQAQVLPEDITLSVDIDPVDLS